MRGGLAQSASPPHFWLSAHEMLMPEDASTRRFWGLGPHLPLTQSALSAPDSQSQQSSSSSWPPPPPCNSPPTLRTGLVSRLELGLLDRTLDVVECVHLAKLQSCARRRKPSRSSRARRCHTRSRSCPRPRCKCRPRITCTPSRICHSRSRLGSRSCASRGPRSRCSSPCRSRSSDNAGLRTSRTSSHRPRSRTRRCRARTGKSTTVLEGDAGRAKHNVRRDPVALPRVPSAC
jgi:hypothetical protein